MSFSGDLPANGGISLALMTSVSSSKRLEPMSDIVQVRYVHLLVIAWVKAPHVA